MRYLIGIGTYFGRDDSIGLRIAEHIAEVGLDQGFRSIDLGGALIDLIHYLRDDAERVLIVDTARMGMAPGEYVYFEPDQVRTRKSLAGISSHEDDLLKVLEFAEATGGPLPALTIMGIEPAELADEPGLSVELERRFDEYVAAAVQFMTADAPQEQPTR